MIFADIFHAGSRQADMGGTRIRRFYVDTGLSGVHLAAVGERMSALGIAGHYRAAEHGGGVVVVAADGNWFSELGEAERAQHILQRGAPDVFAQAVVAFVESEAGGPRPDGVPDRGSQVFKPLTEPKTVVCVDDDPDFADIVSVVLGRMGVECVTVRNGHEALQVIEDLEPDLVLLDLMMPDMHGWEIVERLQANAATQDIPVIIMTGVPSEQDQVFAHVVAGVKDYLQKPVEPDQLRRSVWSVLGRRA